jgi:hypothetical protein
LKRGRCKVVSVLFVSVFLRGGWFMGGGGEEVEEEEEEE